QGVNCKASIARYEPDSTSPARATQEPGDTMDPLDTTPTRHQLAQRCAQLLQAQGQRVAVCESSAGGLIAAALVAVPGSSTFFAGGLVPYSLEARNRLLGVGPEALGQTRPCTEAYALLCARQLRAL